LTLNALDDLHGATINCGATTQAYSTRQPEPPGHPKQTAIWTMDAAPSCRRGIVSIGQ